MSSILPKPGKPLQIQFKKPNQKCTINSLTSTFKKLIPNIKEIKITSKKLPRDINNKKLYIEHVLRPLNVKKGQKTQVQAKEKIIKEEVEYYPDKLKRKVDFKKIVLEPRHDYKVVAATNKRKRCTPVKDAGCLKKLKTDTPSPEISTDELSFEDMIPSSIIHKIKDSKNTSSHHKNMPKTASVLKKTQKTAKNGLKTDSDLKNAPITPSDFKMVPQKVNRRKKSDLKSDSDLKIPRKVLKSDPSSQTEGIEDLLNEESLTDEDFMEILTCPSPVWWEDPPDDNYIEEPIGRFLNQDNLPQNQDCTKVASKTTQPVKTNQDSLAELNIATKSFGNKKLIEKRLNLENLLSSLKNNTVSTNNTKKINGRVRKISSDGSELSVDEDDLVKSLQSIEIPIENETVREKVDVNTNTDDAKDANNISVANTMVDESNNNKTTNENQISIDKTVNNLINNETGIENAVDINDNPKSDTKSSIESETVSNSPGVEKKATSPRKSNRISPKKHQLTKYYNLKSKRPRIIKQNPRNKIIIENNFKTNVNTQKTPEKKLNKKPNNVSKIKKAYLDLLQHSKIENNLAPKLDINITSDKDINVQENTNTIEKTQENKIKIETYKKELAKITEITKQNNKIESSDNIKSESLFNNNIKTKNSKSSNEIPLILPKLTKIPQNLAIASPKSIKSGTSDSTDANSEMDTISDTNVHFIDEYDDKKDELVTVYQIISKNETNTK